MHAGSFYFRQTGEAFRVHRYVLQTLMQVQKGASALAKNPLRRLLNGNRIGGAVVLREDVLGQFPQGVRPGKTRWSGWGWPATSRAVATGIPVNSENSLAV